MGLGHVAGREDAGIQTPTGRTSEWSGGIRWCRECRVQPGWECACCWAVGRYLRCRRPRSGAALGCGNREHLRTLEGHTGDIYSVTFSPDGRTLASGSSDGTVALWEIIPSPDSLEDGQPQVVELPPIKPDVDGDGGVDIRDLLLVAGRLGNSGENREDVNGDGTVNTLDLVLVAGMADDLTGALPKFSNGDMMLRTTQVKNWLEEAWQLDLTDPAIPRGIEYLENLWRR